MVRKVLMAIVIVSLLGACAVPRTKVDSCPAFGSHRYVNHEVEVNWESKQTPSGVRVAGEVSNVRTDTPYNSFNMTVKLLDENGQELGKGSKTFPDRFMGTESFSIDIPVKEPAKFKRINFAYSYGTVEDFYKRDFETVP